MRYDNAVGDDLLEASEGQCYNCFGATECHCDEPVCHGCHCNDPRFWLT
jgi:hypothetical protein